MDKERAKFILQSFRPDGEDANDTTFTEALALATKDRELGEWLADERSQDASFSVMLSKVEIPENLREAIFDVLGGVDEEPAEFDADFIGALASVRAPESLRSQILGAMEVEQKVVNLPVKKKSGMIRTFMWTASAAAVMAVMFVVTFFFAGAGGNALAGTTPKEVEYSAIEMLDSPFFALDLMNDRQAALYEWLVDKSLPTPSQLPAGLGELKGVGCKMLGIGETESRASLICYKKEGTIIHLVVMEKKSLEKAEVNDLKGAVSKCQGCDKNEEWAVTSWTDTEQVYLLLGKMTPAEMASLF